MLDLAAENLFDSTQFPITEVAVNRSDLVDEVAEATGVSKVQAETAVTAFVDAVIADVKAGNRVTVFGFGTFNPTSRAARMGRNPQTGEPVRIAASKSVRFTPASAFKQVLNPRSAKKAAPAKKASKKSAKKASKASKKR
jgi:DNA-binding protein HU-beta